MKIRLLFLLISFIPLLTFAQFENKKTYTISKCNTPPKIDGVLNDIHWSELAKATDFRQLRPDNGKTEREGLNTEVQICYDNNAIYFGVMMFDNAPDSILKELSKRDDEEKNFDIFGIWIDPYGNGMLEYNFGVTAAGVQIDAKYSSSDVDFNWDAVWKSAVKINDKGWIAEFAIPFSALRFPPDNNVWSLNMSRGIRRYREHYTWNFIDVNYDNYGAQGGKLEYLNFDVESPTRLSFMPYATTYYNNYDGAVTYPYNMGMDLKYGINESFTLDMTLVPDFGQVAPDDKVLNLSPFEIQYEEKRQFFTEGTELFDKAGDMFYTRRVSDDLLNASKITGRTKNGLGIGALNAITKDYTNFNVLIFDQVLKNNSSISFSNTNKYIDKEGFSSNVSGISTQLNNKNNTHRLHASFINSNLFNDGSTTKGYSGSFSIEKTKGAYKYYLSSQVTDDKYNTNDLGFSPRNNIISSNLDLYYKQLKPNNNFINSNVSLTANHEMLFTAQKYVNTTFYLNANATLKNYLTFGGFLTTKPSKGYNYFEARTINNGRAADINTPFVESESFGGRVFLSSDYRKRLAVDFSFGGGLIPLYNSKDFGWRISPLFRANDKLSFRYVLSINNERNNTGYAAESATEEPIFALRNTRMITNVLSGSYIISNKMGLSFKLRYHFDQVENIAFKSLGEDGYLNPSDYEGNHNINYTTWTSNLQYNWWFAPGSQLSLVWNNAITNNDKVIRNHWINNVERSLELPQENSLSLKVIYYLDYLYLKKN